MNKRSSRTGMRLTALVPTLLCLCLVLFMAAAYVSDLMTISSKRQELLDVEAKLAQQQADNAELQRILDGDDAAIRERVARDSYDYAAPNERVFVDMSGK